jgi:hypothetical protein
MRTTWQSHPAKTPVTQEAAEKSQQQLQEEKTATHHQIVVENSIAGGDHETTYHPIFEDHFLNQNQEQVEDHKGILHKPLLFKRKKQSTLLAMMNQSFLFDTLPPVKPLKWKRKKVYKLLYHQNNTKMKSPSTNGYPATTANSLVPCRRILGLIKTTSKQGNSSVGSCVVQNYYNAQQNFFSLSKDMHLEKAKKQREKLIHTKMIQIQESIEEKEQRRLKNKRIQETVQHQEIMLLIITIGSLMYNWLKDAPDHLAKFHENKSLDFAARAIQAKWKREMFIRKVFDAVRIQQSLKNHKGQFKLCVRKSRQKMYSRVIKCFLSDVSKYPISYIFYKFHQRVLDAQKMICGFIKCKRARLKALEEQWYHLERDLIAMEDLKMKHKHENNDILSDIAHRKMLSKDLVSIIRNNVNDDSENPFSSEVKPAMSRKDVTSIDLVKILCRLYLEESRHNHIEKQSMKAPHRKQKVQSATHDDAKKLLQGSDLHNILVFDSVVHKQSMFVLYSKHEQLQSKIKGQIFIMLYLCCSAAFSIS